MNAKTVSVSRSFILRFSEFVRCRSKRQAQLTKGSHLHGVGELVRRVGHYGSNLPLMILQKMQLNVS